MLTIIATVRQFATQTQVLTFAYTLARSEHLCAPACILNYSVHLKFPSATTFLSHLAAMPADINNATRLCYIPLDSALLKEASSC